MYDDETMGISIYTLLTYNNYQQPKWAVTIERAGQL